MIGLDDCPGVPDRAILVQDVL
eukprot:COSAG03_NODE_8279_length_817_cov_1.575209_1_plen_21_part_01